MAFPMLLRNASVRGLQAIVIQQCPLTFQTPRKLTYLVGQANKQLLSKNLLCLTNVSVGKRNMSADHSKLWPVEKAVSLLLLGVVPAAIAVPNPVLDNILAVATVAHFHWGLEACVIDYVRPIIFGSAIPKLALGLLYLVSATTLGGLLYYNHSSIGIGQTVRKLWAIQE